MQKIIFVTPEKNIGVFTHASLDRLMSEGWEVVSVTPTMASKQTSAGLEVMGSLCIVLEIHLR